MVEHIYSVLHVLTWIRHGRPRVWAEYAGLMAQLMKQKEGAPGRTSEASSEIQILESAGGWVELVLIKERPSRIYKYR